MDTYKNEADTFDVLHLINCKNINNGSFNFQGGATVQNWRADVIASQITTDSFER